MTHWHTPAELHAFERPRISEQHLAIVLTVLLVLCLVGLCVLPGGPPEPGYPNGHAGTPAATQAP